MRVFDPLRADHWMVSDEAAARCAVCHERFRTGDRTCLIPVDPSGAGGTVAALPAHATCIEKLTGQTLAGAEVKDRIQIEFVRGRACPDCGSTRFHPGPRGGRAHNIRCAECGSTFWYSPPFKSERIAPVEGVYDLSVTRTLAEIEKIADPKGLSEAITLVRQRFPNAVADHDQQGWYVRAITAEGHLYGFLGRKPTCPEAWIEAARLLREFNVTSPP